MYMQTAPLSKQKRYTHVDDQIEFVDKHWITLANSSWVVYIYFKSNTECLGDNSAGISVTDLISLMLSMS